MLQERMYTVTRVVLVGYYDIIGGCNNKLFGHQAIYLQGDPYCRLRTCYSSTREDNRGRYPTRRMMQPSLIELD